MVGRFSPDVGSSEADALRADTASYEFDNIEPIDRSAFSDFSAQVKETPESDSDSDNGASVMQMAFLQLMTQKVIEATANCPEALKLLNSRIRSEKD